MDYRAEATSLEGFVQQLAVGYLARGYRYFFQGYIPDGKDPQAVDAKGAPENKLIIAGLVDAAN